MAQVCDPPGNLDWDFTAQYEAMLRAREQAGWRGWVEGRSDRHQAQGRSGYWWEEETLEWLREDDAAWERKQSGRRV